MNGANKVGKFFNSLDVPRLFVYSLKKACPDRRHNVIAGLECARRQQIARRRKRETLSGSAPAWKEQCYNHKVALVQSRSNVLDYIVDIRLEVCSYVHQLL